MWTTHRSTSSGCVGMVTTPSASEIAPTYTWSRRGQRAGRMYTGSSRLDALKRNSGKTDGLDSMERLERFYKIDQLLKDSKVVPFARLQEGLGVSRATLKRDLLYMRDRFNAPI